MHACMHACESNQQTQLDNTRDLQRVAGAYWGGFPRVSGNPFCKWIWIVNIRSKYSNKAAMYANRVVMIYLFWNYNWPFNFICINTVKWLKMWSQSLWNSKFSCRCAPRPPNQHAKVTLHTSTPKKLMLISQKSEQFLAPQSVHWYIHTLVEFFFFKSCIHL